MSAELSPLPVSIDPAPGEALDAYCERLAAVNGLSRPDLTRRLRAGAASTTFLTIAPDPRVRANLNELVGPAASPMEGATLDDLAGIDATGLDATVHRTWRGVAARGWPPEHGSALCVQCLRADGIWLIAWRHPWVTACVRHGVWLTSNCPSCGYRFRQHRTPLRPVEAVDGTCGNPSGVRGQNCPQALSTIRPVSAPPEVLDTQLRIDLALRGDRGDCLGESTEAASYLAELKALAVLLLHLAIQPGAGSLAGWAPGARADHQRSPGPRGARWALAPPADLSLRGSVLAAADAILAQSSYEAAVDALQPWTDLTPPRPDGQLGWLADHTTMTPALTRLVMAATSSRRRLATLLAAATPFVLPATAIPQVLPAGLYADHLAGALDVTEPTGRLFAALCLARLCSAAPSWADAATILGLPADVGIKTARACSADLLVRPDAFVSRIDDISKQLDPNVDYHSREQTVRRLAADRSWYRPWARTHLPGSRDTSASYAITWLWTHWAHGHIDTSPGWATPPGRRDRAQYRRYRSRLTFAALDALLALVEGTATATREGMAHAGAR